jgi:hypothetical protein
MNDRFDLYADSVTAPATRAVAVAPSDSDPLPFVPKGLYVATGGTIVLRGSQDTADSTWKNVPNGAVLPIRASHVRATGTSASGILALG